MLRVPLSRSMWASSVAQRAGCRRRLVYVALLEDPRAALDEGQLRASGEEAGPANNSSSLTMDFNVCGDIVRVCVPNLLSPTLSDCAPAQLLPAPKEVCWNLPFCKISGPCVAANEAAGTFHISVVQYSTFYRSPTARALSVVPITSHFDGARYKAKKPMPPSISFVSVEGFLTRFEVGGGSPDIHLSVDIIRFPREGDSTPPRHPGACHPSCHSSPFIPIHFFSSCVVFCRPFSLPVRL
jgi:hypothetical protein